MAFGLAGGGVCGLGGLRLPLALRHQRLGLGKRSGGRGDLGLDALLDHDPVALVERGDALVLKPAKLRLRLADRALARRALSRRPQQARRRPRRTPPPRR